MRARTFPARSSGKALLTGEQSLQAIHASDAVRDLVALIDNLKRLVDEMAQR